VDSHGDVGASAGGGRLVHADTRFLSHLERRLNGAQPLLLGSNVPADDNTLLAVDLTIRIYMPTRASFWKRHRPCRPHDLLWRGTAYQRIAVRNHAFSRPEISLSFHFDNDFADLSSVRRAARATRTTSRTVITAIIRFS